MFLIVGLGNPGKQYKYTRHNAGFMAVDILSDCYNFSWIHNSRFSADITTGQIKNEKVLLCKPTTFMNLSGNAVQSIVSYYKIPLEKIIVIHDDIDLEFLKLKCKIGGSSAGHNGLKSIDHNIGQYYIRIRLGIGRPNMPGVSIHNFVLDNFSSIEKEVISNKVLLLAKQIDLFFCGNIKLFKSLIGNL